MSTRPGQPTKTRASARQRREAARLRKQRQQRLTYAGVAGLLVVLLAVVVVLIAGSSKKSSTASSTSDTATGQLLAPAGAGAPGTPIDGISCGATESLVYHIHAHLAVFVNGQQRTIPATIGFTNSCLYWLHSHTSDGIIHIESPEQHTFTLGNYFDVWGQPLSTTQVGPASGPVIAYVNGQRYSGDPRQIPLDPQTNVQLDVGTDVSPKPYHFPAGL